MYDIRMTRQAQKDAIKVEHSGLKPKVMRLVRTVRVDPYEESDNFERLKYDLKGTCSRRINKQHRFVYEVIPNTEGIKTPDGELYEGIVKIISMWTHYHY